MAGVALSQFGGAGNTPAGIRVRPTTLVSIFDADGVNELGYITGIDESQSRPADRARVLSAKLAGRTIQQVTKPGEVTLTVNGFYIYKASPGTKVALNNNRLFARILQSDVPIVTMEQQKMSFVLLVREYMLAEDTPIAVGIEQGLVPSDVTVYHDCKLISTNLPRSLDSAFMAESATIQVGWVGDI